MFGNVFAELTNIKAGLKIHSSYEVETTTVLNLTQLVKLKLPNLAAEPLGDVCALNEITLVCISALLETSAAFDLLFLKTLRKSCW